MNTVKVELNVEYTRDCAVVFHVGASVDVGADLLEYKSVCDDYIELSPREFQSFVEAYEQHKLNAGFLMNHVEIYDEDEDESIADAIESQCLKALEKIVNLDPEVNDIEFTLTNGNFVTGCI